MQIGVGREGWVKPRPVMLGPSVDGALEQQGENRLTNIDEVDRVTKFSISMNEVILNILYLRKLTYGTEKKTV